ncbi:LINE-1 retrotransposable element ORF2 protein [Bienertia sinuspersici]
MKCYRPKSQVEGCIIKVDLKNAYDSIDQSFMENLMHALNFPHKFVQVVMECVPTPTFSLMLNGTPYGFFSRKRGLR